jgi:peptidoglycan/LPS O-acetylase OafA/YrhL
VKTTQRLGALTSLRFFAAFHVLLFHALPWGERLASQQPLVRAFALFCSHGFVAVGFFFTLSGFILTYNYPAQGLDRRKFYLARVARVYPVYLLGLSSALPFFVVRQIKTGDLAHGAIELAVALSLTQAFLPTLWSAVNPPGWSLSVEAFFYLSFPWLALQLSRFVTSGRRAALAASFAYGCALSAPVLGIALADSDLSHEDVSLVANTLRYSPVLALPEFAFGIVLGYVHVRGLSRASIWRIAALPASVLLAAALATDAVPYILLHCGVLLPLFGVIILRLADETGVPAWLSSHPLQKLGEASYSLYVLHLSVWIVIKIVLERSGFDVGSAWVFPLVAVSAVAVSLLSHDLVEAPARAWLSRRWALSRKPSR